MVGYHPLKYELSKFDHALAGGVSGIVTRSLTQPLDVIKIRFQLQTEPIAKTPTSKYKGLRQSFRKIIREEGFWSLWKGHVAVQSFSLIYGPIAFASFEFLTRQAWHYLPQKMSKEYRPVTHFLCGSMSGCIASVACQPFDVIRTRLVAQGEPKIYNGIIHAARCMLAEGTLTFFKGMVPTLVQAAPYAGLQFGFYSLFKNIWNMAEHYAEEHGHHHTRYAGMLESLVCGSAAGIVGKGAVYPLDVVKKRLQIQGFEEARVSFGRVKRYNGLIHCVLCIVKDEGVIGLYKGLGPSLLKAAAVTGLSFFVYEQCCSLIVELKSGSDTD
ncbi:unnamed protein product [Owenia fusiformis]|uniref:Mitochondrial thiamine pyrophosphate carrier n=1 Tax=Owenia fusiformis TaxID=6347 RepID=A0A8J1XR06_OWEFU|nr:unnamed protein product [Owenia fusiformis]